MFIVYSGVLGICYVLCRLFRPISLGQLHSLRRSLLVANAIAAFLLLIPMAFSVVALVNSHRRDRQAVGDENGLRS
jgi:hypothetical protein